MQAKGTQAQLNGQEQLFLGLVEQLARPLQQITQLAELADGDNPSEAALRWQLARAISAASLQLVESYALSLRVQGNVTTLSLEPVTVSSLLYDTAQALQPFARQYGVELELDTGSRLQPILADRSVLQSALTSLGQVFVLSQAEAEESAPVRLSAYRSRYGIVAGLYGRSAQLGADSLRRARALSGRAREPLQRLVSGPAAGVFVADSLLGTLAARLHVARYHSLTGLAATLTPSQQLQLI
ncbi:MAG TPA: hypothetical protein VLE99_02415 [Candidatus Saccharimonadales bacterium]|nr:hypothetical protein [Candidatus Saccharimonadales bacterium]